MKHRMPANLKMNTNKNNSICAPRSAADYV